MTFDSTSHEGANGSGWRGGGSGSTRPKPPLHVIPFADDAQPVLADLWLIEDVLPLDGLGVVFGASGSGKTFVVLDMALTIGSGRRLWRDKYVEAGAVLYLSMEGPRLFPNRISAYRRERGDAAWFLRSPATVDLRSNDADADRVVKAARLHAERCDQPVRLIVVDTLSRALAGGRENTAEDMGAFINICASMQRDLGCCVLVIHHTGKNAAQGARGHSSLVAAVDVELSVADGILKTTKQRDGVAGLEFGFALRGVPLGTSPRGKAIASCVVDPVDVTDRSSRANRAVKLGKCQHQALEALRQYADDHGRPNPGGVGWPEPGRVRVIERDAFMDFLTGKMTNDSAKDRRRSARSALDGLIEKGVVQTNADCLWVCG